MDDYLLCVLGTCAPRGLHCIVQTANKASHGIQYVGLGVLLSRLGESWPRPMETLVEYRVMMFTDLVIFAVGHGRLPTDRKRDEMLMFEAYSFPERLHGETNFWSQRHSLSSFSGTNQLSQFAPNDIIAPDALVLNLQVQLDAPHVYPVGYYCKTMLRTI